MTTPGSDQSAPNDSHKLFPALPDEGPDNHPQQLVQEGDGTHPASDASRSRTHSILLGDKSSLLEGSEPPAAIAAEAHPHFAVDAGFSNNYHNAVARSDDDSDGSPRGASGAPAKHPDLGDVAEFETTPVVAASSAEPSRNASIILPDRALYALSAAHGGAAAPLGGSNGASHPFLHLMDGLSSRNSVVAIDSKPPSRNVSVSGPESVFASQTLNKARQQGEEPAQSTLMRKVEQILQPNDGKLHILLGVTGSLHLTSLKLMIAKLQEIYGDRASIQIVLTSTAGKMLQPNDIPKSIHVWCDEDEWEFWKQRSDPVIHIELRRWAHILVIAPLSANTLGKIAMGLCDNLLTSTVRAWNSQYPILVAPAMVSYAYANPSTRWHVRLIKDEMKFIEVLKPTEKVAGSHGGVGLGGMMAWNEIVDRVVMKLGGYPDEPESVDGDDEESPDERDNDDDDDDDDDDGDDGGDVGEDEDEDEDGDGDRKEGGRKE